MREQQFTVCRLLLIHHCPHHHSSSVLLTPHVLRSLSIPHLLFPDIHLSCGAFALHTIVILFITQFLLPKPFKLEIDFYLYISIPLPALPYLMHHWFHAPQEVIVLACLQHCSIVAMAALVQVGRITDASVVANVLCFDRMQLNFWSCMLETVKVTSTAAHTIYARVCGVREPFS